MPVFVLKKGGAGENTKNPAITDESEGSEGEEFREMKRQGREKLAVSFIQKETTLAATKTSASMYRDD